MIHKPRHIISTGYRHKTVLVLFGNTTSAEVAVMEMDDYLNDGWTIDCISPSHTDHFTAWLVVLKQLITDNVTTNELQQKS